MDGLLELQMNNAMNASRTSGGTPNITPGMDKSAARHAAEEFESVFLSQMLAAMFAQTEQDSAFGGGPGEKAFSGILHEEYAKIMSQAGGIGLADRLTAEILKYQEG